MRKGTELVDLILVSLSLYFNGRLYLMQNRPNRFVYYELRFSRI